MNVVDRRAPAGPRCHRPSVGVVTPQFAPNITALERQGETFDHYFVADSLCCPSRSTIFTGLFPHDTKVTTNVPPTGGFRKFQSRRLDQRTYAVALHDAGYATSMLGKYLNGYGDPLTRRTAPVPPGWSDWHVSNNSGYAEFNYSLNDNGAFHKYTGPQNYGVDVLNADTQAFIRRSAKQPFAIEVATFAPHQPFIPAPRNAKDFPGLTEPRDPSFNTENVNPPAWLNRTTIGTAHVANLDAIYRKRAQAVESVDKLVGDTEATLAAEHLTDSTYLVFSSDNGYHLGQHRLNRGKQTAFDTDIRVPLIVAGPGIPKGRVVPQVAQNTDLYPTFVQLARATPATPVNGHSLVPLLHPPAKPPVWRTVALVEHHGDNNSPADPDHENGGGNPPSYEAIRISAPAPSRLQRTGRGGVRRVCRPSARARVLRPHQRSVRDRQRREVAHRRPAHTAACDPGRARELPYCGRMLDGRAAAVISSVVHRRTREQP